MHERGLFSPFFPSVRAWRRERGRGEEGDGCLGLLPREAVAAAGARSHAQDRVEEMDFSYPREDP